ncbi:MAG: S8 family serine peptidase [Pseudomonadota bacterium]
MKRQMYLQSAAIALMALSTPVYAAGNGNGLVLNNGASPTGLRGVANGYSPAAATDISPFSGDINPFSGDINPFSGDINPFSGDINPFRGDINPFYGDVSPFWGDVSPFSGNVSPFATDIQPFWGSLGVSSTELNGVSTFWANAGPQWGDINQAWEALGAYGALSQSSYAAVRDDFQTLVLSAQTQWGAAVQAATGQSFQAGFLDPLLNQYGIDLNDASSFENVDAEARSRFFLDFYDGLSAYNSFDQVDHWSGTINWTPAITQDQGEGHDSVIGLLDVAISMSDDNIEFLDVVGGYTASSSEHGAAVASLIAGRHDGQGVLGIAPRSTIKAYNPFDATGSSSIADVNAGVQALVNTGANVINMSLGVPGYVLHQDLANTFSFPAIQNVSDSTVFVVAAGNEGAVQTTNVTFASNGSFDNLLFVGSVDPSKNISFFSNTPGDACIDQGNGCTADNRLRNRFLVAPGELILVSDNAGGTTRLSGTSFAAPLVTGAVSLIHDRWPWLQNFAKETTDIILESAEDLGAPGVDDVYGHGLLDVEAATAPLDFNNLTFQQPNTDGTVTNLTPTQLRDSVLTVGQLGLWEAAGAELVATETVGNTFRDFNIPLSTVLAGNNAANGEKFQRHVYTRLVDWAQGTNSVAAAPVETAVGKIGEFGIVAQATPVSPFAPVSEQDKPFNTSLLVASKNRRVTFQLGEGTGAVALTHTEGFDHYSDHNPESGGVNPFLGLASGGLFANLVSEIKPGLKLAFGFTQVVDENVTPDETTGQLLPTFDGIQDYRANALVADVSYALTDNVRFNVSLTHLSEENGVLGAQGAGAFSLDEGATTNAVTFGASYQFSPRFSLSASATAGRTQSRNGGDAFFGIDEDGLTTSAFQVSASANNLFAENDRVRLTFSQPLNVETGSLSYDSVQVVDRATGELGVVTDFINLGDGGRRYVTEAQYAFPLLDGAAEISLFGRMDFGAADIDGEYNAIAGGTRFTLAF